MWFYDPTYILFMVPAFILMLATQWYVNAAYKKWSRIPSRSRFSGEDAARRLIQQSNLYDVKVETVSGKLTDHYDPRDKILRLSEGVSKQTSVASLAIAAHELGHAIQDQEGYSPLRFRSMMVPAVNLGSKLGWILILAGLMLSTPNLAWIGLVFFSASAIFALATLPVEFNASSRARLLLTNSGIVVGEDEIRGVNTVLNAAALTYIAALVTAVMQILYYVFLITGMGRRRR